MTATCNETAQSFNHPGRVHLWTISGDAGAPVRFGHLSTLITDGRPGQLHHIAATYQHKEHP